MLWQQASQSDNTQPSACAVMCTRELRHGVRAEHVANMTLSVSRDSLCIYLFRREIGRDAKKDACIVGYMKRSSHNSKHKNNV